MRCCPDPLRSTIAVLALAASGLAQCQPEWLPGDPLARLDGVLAATTTWDPDGAGPQPLHLVVGGKFDVDHLLAARLAMWDGQTWVDLAPPAGEITALGVWNGQLVAGVLGSVHLRGPGGWTLLGTLGLGSGFGRARALVVHNGALVAVGDFDTIDPFAPTAVPANGVAAWNGTAWSAFGPGFPGSARCAVSFLGQLYVGGDTGPLNSPNQPSLQRWNGTSWSSVGMWNGPVLALAARVGTTVAASSLFAGGSFSQFDGAPMRRVARFQPSTGSWSQPGSLAPGQTIGACTGLLVRPTGLGTFEVAAAMTGTTEQVWRWNGTAWSSLGTTTAPLEGLEPTGLVHFGGSYVLALAADQGAGPNPRRDGLRRHDAAGNSWTPVIGPGIDGTVHAVLAADGDVVLGGRFAAISGVATNGIARGQPGAWQPLGGGMAGGLGVGPAVYALARLPNGDLVAGGDFDLAGGVAAANVARWNGSAWTPLGAGVGGVVLALLTLPDGSLVAGGAFATAGGAPAARIARWNGSSWAPLGAGMQGGDVHTLARLPDGSLVAGGTFAGAGGALVNSVARWNGATWSSLAGGIAGPVYALAAGPDGTLWAGGEFAQAGAVMARNVARWNGTAWATSGAAAFAQPDDVVLALAALPNGDLIAGGREFQLGPGTAETCLARLRAGVWSSLAVAGPAADAELYAAAVTIAGRIVVAGQILTVAGDVSAGVATLAPTCPASALPYGNGCTGGGGADLLTATTLPWLGGVLRARATGLPSTSLALALYGFAPLALPLDQVFVEAAPGCTLLLVPDLYEVLLPSAGAVDTAIAVPMSPSLVGLAAQHQVLAFEFDAGGLAAVTAGNGLALVVGSLGG